jgi:hypothetical protein
MRLDGWRNLPRLGPFLHRGEKTVAVRILAAILSVVVSTTLCPGVARAQGADCRNKRDPRLNDLSGDWTDHSNGRTVRIRQQGANSLQSGRSFPGRAPL